MSIDYKFALEMFQRYSTHLQDVLTSIETNTTNYDKEEKELERLIKFKPQEYSYKLELKKLKKKKKEADIKLSHIVPRMQQMAEQIEELKKYI